MLSTLKTLKGHIALVLSLCVCLSVHPSFCQCIRLNKIVRVLKFHRYFSHKNS